MRWKKLGHIFKPDQFPNWAAHSALQPTPILIDDRIRVYCGFRDEAGTSRVGYVDLDAADPSRVVAVSSRPVLDVGKPSAFDQDGVVPCAIVRRGDQLFLYYAGYLKGEAIRFQVFGGLATSSDGGETFARYSEQPVLGETDEAPLFRVLHSVIPENGKWRAWYGAGSRFEQGKTKTLPVYNIRSMESADGIVFPNSGTVAVDIQANEHRVGRPYVVKTSDRYLMFFGSGSEEVPYTLTYATSSDGLTWERHGEIAGLGLSNSGQWDSQMMAYPAVISAYGKTYMLYNGNDYGRAGFGCAELASPWR